MKYTPTVKKPEEILIIIGFTPCKVGFGYELPLQNPNRKTKVDNSDIPRRRFHAYIRGNDIDVHQDRPSKRTHKAHNFGSHRKEICQIFYAIDTGQEYKNTRAYKYLLRHAQFTIKI